MTIPAFDSQIPATAARKVEFVSATSYSGGSELHPPGSGVDLAAYRQYVRALDEAGFDYTLNGYSANSADSFVVASATGLLTERIKPIVALRPNTTFPLVAAQKLATLDQLTEGRAVVHLISGGSDAEQARQGDYVPKDRRYARTSEYIDVLRRAWTAKEPFSHEGEFYKFDDFGPGFATYSGEPIPISIGGQSNEAFEVGGVKADWFTFWGEPLAEVRKEIDRVHAIADRAGRPRQRIWVTFRPIIEATDELAWERAYQILGVLAERARAGQDLARRWIGGNGAPQNKGSQRALGFAGAAERYDRALWTPTASATGGAGASTALVGSYETVAAAILDYVDAGADIVSIRGYDGIVDVEKYGTYILPLVRQELAHREATGQRGTLQAEHLGYYGNDFTSVADTAAARARG
ncbi:MULTISPECIES: LLM class flavin-dependent oxidoreductase [Pseudofrankia]|uniref:LLM class flavin-dependent oxidoreductase n=1 Tax=Pseudofrankia TaxID=2994363 RepID=UPI000234D2FD|nr:MULTISPECIES: LLM class flavin-dependent oxidoreductase [Pseudofrankia]OHV33898.1 alkanesulfonate monooxygenase [Pseudofrankia sp. EUN1h]